MGISELPGQTRYIAAIALLFLLLTLQGMAAQPANAAEGHKYVFLDEPIPPYTIGQEGDICEEGLTVEIFDELFGRLGLEYEIRLVPWARAIDSVRHRTCDGIPLLIKTEERERFLRFSDPVVENRELLYFLPDRLGNFQWEQLDDLKPYMIGLIRGYAYAEGLMKAIENQTVRVSYSKDSTLNFSMLRAGRVDLIIEDESVAGPLLAAHPEWAASIASAPKPLSSYEWHIGLSLHTPLLQHMDDINRALREMRRDGTLARILDKR